MKLKLCWSKTGEWTSSLDQTSNDNDGTISGATYTSRTNTVNYTSGDGSNTLTFNYTVADGHNNSDLDYSSTSALTLNGGSIVDPAGNASTLTLASPGASGSLAANKALIINNALLSGKIAKTFSLI